MRILKHFNHFLGYEEDHRLTVYRDRTATAPLPSPTDSGAQSLAHGSLALAVRTSRDSRFARIALALLALLVPRTILARPLR
jgi:hypothetical protein